MNTEAFILVGGRSSRLGRDKAVESIGGQTLAERSLRTVESSGVASKIFFVAGNQVGFAIEAARLNALFVFDVIEGRGPLGGLHAALTHATNEWVFVFACDLPFVSSGLITHLSEFTSEEHDKFGAVVPEQPDGRIQPLCAFYKVAEARPVVDELIHRPRPSPPMREVVERLNAKIVRPDEYGPIVPLPETFSNINTDKDLEIARRFERQD